MINFSCANLIIAYDASSLGELKKPLPNQKIELDKIKEIAQKNNIKVIFKAIPWKRALLLVEKGLIDGLIQASYKNNRSKYAKYPMKDNTLDRNKRLNDGDSYYIYRNINSKLRWDGKNFSNEGTVAAMETYAVVDDLLVHKNISVKTFSNNIEIIRKVAKQKVDAYAGSSRVTEKVLKEFPSLSKQIVRELSPIRKKDYFLIFSKKIYSKKANNIEAIWHGLEKFNKKN